VLIALSSRFSRRPSGIAAIAAVRAVANEHLEDRPVYLHTRPNKTGSRATPRVPDRRFGGFGVWPWAGPNGGAQESSFGSRLSDPAFEVRRVGDGPACVSGDALRGFTLSVARR